jgi:hypothetical protein
MTQVAIGTYFISLRTKPALRNPFLPRLTPMVPGGAAKHDTAHGKTGLAVTSFQ